MIVYEVASILTRKTVLKEETEKGKKRHDHDDDE